jgi:hypothetical protein
MSIKEQIADMAVCWPQLRKASSSPDAVRWRGRMEGQIGRYRLDIRYTLNTASRPARGLPEVRVLKPELVKQPGNSDGILPHMYGPIEDPKMCLFDPAQNQWNPSMSLARTIVPWALDWLACYEMWRIDGKWRGGGRHLGDPIPQRATEQEIR